MNTFSKMIAIAIAVLVLFMGPTMYFTHQHDVVIQNFVANETNKFVSDIRNSGVITKEDYERFLSILDKTNVVYKIEITHSRLIVNPNYSNGSSLVDTSSYYSNVYEDTIREALFDSAMHEYTMSRGDYLTITVSNNSKTMGTKMHEILTGTAVRTSQIVATSGGEIKNEVK